METETQKKEVKSEVYQYAESLLLENQFTKFQAKKELIEKGLDEENAQKIIDEISIEHKKQDNGAKSDIFWGAIWCFGGIIATVMDFGYFFWGAILFGGFQMVKGLTDLYES
ncbi:MAG: hypothetical protein ACPGVH_06175 [Chitinophagales bacterium]